MATIHISPSFFSEKEKTLIESGELSAAAFRYESGVCGLRFQNALGEIVTLPFHGQQIWSVAFQGRDLVMKSMFPEPRDTRNYMENYGAFLLHCGALAMGVPSAEDTHPLHGELPHAPYLKAQIILDEDEQGAYLGLTGEYQHTIAFGNNYIARPLVKLYAGSSLLHVSMTVTNLAETEMEYMYMAHVNFRPVDNGRIVYSAIATPENVRIRQAPPHLKFKPDYKAFLEDLGQHPEKHHVLLPGAPYDPEAVFNIDYLTDTDGWAHSLQVHPDGSADYISHRPSQLDKGVRWISRTPDQDALGLFLPATAEAEGYTMEKAKGNVKVLPPKGEFTCEMVIGAVAAEAANQLEAKVNDILAD
jgi:hypothetical protein